MDWSTLIFVGLILALADHIIGYRKGYPFFRKSSLGVLTLPFIIMARPNLEGLAARQRRRGLRKCPSCAEWIKTEAHVCRFCGRDVPPLPPEPVITPRLKITGEHMALAAIGLCLLGVVAFLMMT